MYLKMLILAYNTVEKNFLNTPIFKKAFKNAF